MSRILRWRNKVERKTLLLTSDTFLSHCFTQLSSISTHLNHLHFGIQCWRESLIKVQERYKWGHSGSDSNGLNHHNIRKIRVDANFPRCFKHMDLLFSFPNRHNFASLIPLGALDVLDDAHANTGASANLCPNCERAYYFCPDMIVPLQGSFVEISRLNNTPTRPRNSNGADENGNCGGDEHNRNNNTIVNTNSRFITSF
ncbi:hypothetical protein CIPAW_11G106900 [Carya illinoinensis]|uniref:Uncharacterized protein n=1 Tax=Carya illinoinensis TaxID=32201 RepID=A0A8T1P677_CARIL|nr:hypothetical protein CIPAW_11G106900 [Carya illinoinensis]